MSIHVCAVHASKYKDNNNKGAYIAAILDSFLPFSLGTSTMTSNSTLSTLAPTPSIPLTTISRSPDSSAESTTLRLFKKRGAPRMKLEVSCSWVQLLSHLITMAPQYPRSLSCQPTLAAYRQTWEQQGYLSHVPWGSWAIPPRPARQSREAASLRAWN